MKITFTARRQREYLFPHGDDAREAFATIKDGSEVLVTCHTARSIRQLKLFWSLMTLLADNCDLFSGKEDAADNIKIDCGEIEWFVHHASGVKFGRSRSIAFESMAQDRFNRFMNRVLYIIESRYLPNASADLMRRVHEIIDGPEATGKAVGGKDPKPSPMQRTEADPNPAATDAAANKESEAESAPSSPIGQREDRGASVDADHPDSHADHRVSAAVVDRSAPAKDAGEVHSASPAAEEDAETSFAKLLREAKVTAAAGRSAYNRWEDKLTADQIDSLDAHRLDIRAILKSADGKPAEAISTNPAPTTTPAPKIARPAFDDRDAWKKAGAQAEAKGMRRTATPPELRVPEGEQALRAWLDGYDLAKSQEAGG